MNPELQMEELRRRAGLGASSAGVGAEATNAQTPTNPIANAGLTTQPPEPSGGMEGGATGAPSDGTVSGMKQQKGEAQKLTDAMIWRMKRVTERGE
jgi:hypothetical protein